MAYGTVNADIIGTSVAGSNLGAGNASNFKNRIINGDMRIDQRNAGASVTPSNNYTLDRWQGGNSQASKYTVQQNAGSVTPPVGFTNYLGVTSSSAYSITSSDYFFLTQIVEGLNCTDLGFGTADAKTVTLSFWVRSSLTGTFGGSILNYSVNRSYTFNYTISSANTWTQISVTIPGDTTGTWLTTNSGGIVVRFGLGTGSTYTQAAGSWGTVNAVQPPSTVSVVGTNGATFYITGVQLEVGSSATGFEYVDYTTQLAMCQRYYQKSYSYSITPGTTVLNENAVQMDWGSQTSGIASVVFALPVVMRTDPTATAYDLNGTSGKIASLDGGANVTNNVSYNNLNPRAERFYLRIYGLTVYGISFMYTLNAEL